jgi:hypothetical protein
LQAIEKHILTDLAALVMDEMELRQFSTRLYGSRGFSNPAWSRPMEAEKNPAEFEGQQ